MIRGRRLDPNGVREQSPGSAAKPRHPGSTITKHPNPERVPHGKGLSLQPFQGWRAAVLASWGALRDPRLCSETALRF